MLGGLNLQLLVAQDVKKGGWGRRFPYRRLLRMKFCKSKEDKVLDLGKGSLQTQHGSWFSFSVLLFSAEDKMTILGTLECLSSFFFRPVRRIA